MKKIIINCEELLHAYKKGELGYMKMPEDENPGFNDAEKSLIYFTLPMSLNYQRNSYKLWEGAKASYEDSETEDIFDLKKVSEMPRTELQEKLLKYKVALQPNKHTDTYQTIATTIYKNWGNISHLLSTCDYDYLQLKDIVQKKYKKEFPYLSGPKIFNYWCHIIGEYCNIKLKNTQYIEIAPDTHVMQCSVKLGVITKEEARNLTKENISKRWREALKGSGINPIDMHSPLWFWSRNDFKYELKSFT